MDANTNDTIIKTAPAPIDDSDDSGESLGTRLLSRKFLITALFSITGCIALLHGIFLPADFNWLVGIVLVGHGTANIVDKKMNS